MTTCLLGRPVNKTVPVTGYGKTRARGARKGDDSMRKRVRAMLSFMNVCEVVQPNLGRIHIDKEALVEEVERNSGRIIFDSHGYEQFKLQEGLDEPHSDTPQYVRPRGGALHDRSERDRKQDGAARAAHGQVNSFHPYSSERGHDNGRFTSPKVSGSYQPRHNSSSSERSDFPPHRSNAHEWQERQNHRRESPDRQAPLPHHSAEGREGHRWKPSPRSRYGRM